MRKLAKSTRNRLRPKGKGRAEQQLTWIRRTQRGLLEIIGNMVKKSLKRN